MVKYSSNILQHADKKLRGNKEIVLAAVRQNGEVLEYADKKLKNNKEVVLAAVTKDGSALRFADKKLKGDKKFVLAAVKKNGSALDYADDSLKKDKEVILVAVKNDGNALQYADKKLQGDKEIVLAAIKSELSFIQYAGDEVRSDKAFMEKYITEEEIFEKYFINKKNLKKYIYSVDIRGSGGERKSSEITKKTYDFFANDNGLLISHVHADNNENIPEDVMIGPWYEAGNFFESSCYSFGDSALTLDREDQTIEIPMDEKTLKKMGVKLIRTKKDFKDGVKKGKTGYFFLGERAEKGTTSSELVIDHPINPNKLKVETCNFNGWETIESITYDNDSIDCHMGDSTHKNQEFQVIKVKN